MQNLSIVLASSIGAVLAVQAAGGYGFLISAVGVTVVIAIFGELAPKVLAARATERYALIVARPVEALTLATRPLVAALIVVPNLFSRLFLGQRLVASPTVTEAELRMLIDIGATEGAVAEQEAELLERVFQFRDRRVNEIMVPRTEVVWLEADTHHQRLLRPLRPAPSLPLPRVQREHRQRDGRGGDQGRAAGGIAR